MKIKGIGLIIKSIDGKYLFQESDKNIKVNPGAIAPFGGGVNVGETSVECAIREAQEELELVIREEDLQRVGIFESLTNPGTYLEIFFVSAVDPKNLVLHEGRNIVEMTFDEAIANPIVTDFTKEVLRVL